MKLPFHVDISQSTNRKKKLNTEVLFMLYMYILGDYFTMTREPILNLKMFPYRAMQLLNKNMYKYKLTQ